MSLISSFIIRHGADSVRLEIDGLADGQRQYKPIDSYEAICNENRHLNYLSICLSARLAITFNPRFSLNSKSKSNNLMAKRHSM